MGVNDSVASYYIQEQEEDWEIMQSMQEDGFFVESYDEECMNHLDCSTIELY